MLIPSVESGNLSFLFLCIQQNFVQRIVQNFKGRIFSKYIEESYPYQQSVP